MLMLDPLNLQFNKAISYLRIMQFHGRTLILYIVIYTLQFPRIVGSIHIQSMILNLQCYSHWAVTVINLVLSYCTPSQCVKSLVTVKKSISGVSLNLVLHKQNWVKIMVLMDIVPLANHCKHVLLPFSWEHIPSINFQRWSPHPFTKHKWSVWW